jgi:hypothetical protein
LGMLVLTKRGDVGSSVATLTFVSIMIFAQPNA